MTIYTSIHSVTQANKHKAYEKLVVLVQHLTAFGVDLIALSLTQDNKVSVTLTGDLPAEQLEHLGLA